MMGATLLQPGLLSLLEKDPLVKGQEIWGTREYSELYSLSLMCWLMEDFFLSLESVTEGQRIPI